MLLLKLVEAHLFALAWRLKAKRAAFPGFLAAPKGYGSDATGSVLQLQNDKNSEKAELFHPLETA